MVRLRNSLAKGFEARARVVGGEVNDSDCVTAQDDREVTLKARPMRKVVKRFRCIGLTSYVSCENAVDRGEAAGVSVECFPLANRESDFFLETWGEFSESSNRSAAVLSVGKVQQDHKIELEVLGKIGNGRAPRC